MLLAPQELVKAAVAAFHAEKVTAVHFRLELNLSNSVAWPVVSSLGYCALQWLGSKPIGAHRFNRHVPLRVRCARSTALATQQCHSAAAERH